MSYILVHVAPHLMRIANTATYYVQKVGIKTRPMTTSVVSIYYKDHLQWIVAIKVLKITNNIEESYFKDNWRKWKLAFR